MGGFLLYGIAKVTSGSRGGQITYCNSIIYNPYTMMEDKEKYLAPLCEELEMHLEGVIAASGGLKDDEFEVVPF